MSSGGTAEGKEQPPPGRLVSTISTISTPQCLRFLTFAAAGEERNRRQDRPRLSQGLLLTGSDTTIRGVLAYLRIVSMMVQERGTKQGSRFCLPRPYRYGSHSTAYLPPRS